MTDVLDACTRQCLNREREQEGQRESEHECERQPGSEYTGSAAWGGPLRIKVGFCALSAWRLGRTHVLGFRTHVQVAGVVATQYVSAGNQSRHTRRTAKSCKGLRYGIANDAVGAVAEGAALQIARALMPVGRGLLLVEAPMRPANLQ